MTSYKITSIDQNGAVVEIDFGADIFVVGYSDTETDEQGNPAPIMGSTQSFKFDGLDTTSADTFKRDIEAYVQAKVTELLPPQPDKSLLDLVGERTTIPDQTEG